MARAYIGLGANLGDRRASVASALTALDGVDGIDVVEVSTLRDTTPVGPVAQPRFLNGAAVVETTLSPRALLEALLSIERQLGRVRGPERYGPRVIDLDLLLYDDAVIDEPGLSVPHPRLHERRFALEPLAELDPALEVPGRGPVTAVVAALPAERPID